MEGYLAWKWGLTSSLPADHPYKSACPRFPPIANKAPTSITNTAAIFNGALDCLGTNYDVYVHWGTTDKTTNFTWDSSAYVASWTNVASTNICYTNSSLSPNTTYYYTFRATNAVTNIWASPSWRFSTLLSTARGTVFLFE